MHIINQSEVAAVRFRSPRGAFELLRHHMSLALGGKKDVGPWGGGHPFDIEWTVLPAGKRNFPYHAHAAQTEYYIVVAGSGQVLDGAGRTTPIKAGDHFIFPPGEAHQLINDSAAELKYFVIADHSRVEVTTYPRTGKRAIEPEGRCIRIEEADYFDEEE